MLLSEADFGGFIRELRIRLSRDLPGFPAQLKMAPEVRKKLMPDESVLKAAKQSAVLILFYPHAGEPHLVFMLRPADTGPHSGQVSFPGGKREENDADLQATALREANEEIGIDISEVNVIGSISSLYIPPSGFHVSPVIGYVQARPVFKPDAVEVEKIIELPLSYLLDESSQSTREIFIRSIGSVVTSPCYLAGDHIIWGATAMMLSELMEIIRD